MTTLIRPQHRLWWSMISPLWTPANLTNLVFWNSPDYGVVTGTGGVSGWSQKYGGSITFSQATTSRRPDMTTLNGRPILDYVASADDQLISGSFTTGIGSGEFYEAHVITIRTARFAQLMTMGHTTGGQRGGLYDSNQSTGFFGFWRGSTVTFPALGIPTLNKTLILEFRYDGSSTLYCRLNGSAWASTATTVVVTDNDIGLGNDGFGTKHDGLYADVILAKSTTTAEQDKALIYLANKWAVTLGPPSNGPSMLMGL